MFNLLRKFWVGEVSSNMRDKKNKVGLTDSANTEQTSVSDAKLPPVVVTGDESAGKSTVLGNITQTDVLPNGEGIITRQALKMELRFNPATTVANFTLAIPGKPVLTSTNEEIIKNAIVANHDEIKNSGRGISEDEAILRIESNAVPYIDLIDLPGQLAVRQKGEPENMAEMVKKLAERYLNLPNAIPLGIFEAHANIRNSPAGDLLFDEHGKPKYKSMIKVYTKSDLSYRHDWKKRAGFTGPLSGLFSRIKAEIKEDDTVPIVALYNIDGVTSFEQKSIDEQDWFKEALGADPASPLTAKQDYEQLKNNVGVNSLLNYLNKSTENVARPIWKAEESKRQNAILTHLRKDLADIGSEQKTVAILNIVTQKLIENDPNWEALIKKVWNALPKTLPQPQNWEYEPTIDMPRFLTNLQVEIQTRIIEICVVQAPLKLARYTKFRTDFQAIVKKSFETMHTPFLNRWEELSKAIMIQHDISPQYTVAQWERAILCCTMREIFQHLHEDVAGPNNKNQTIAQQLTALGANLSCEENPETVELRRKLNAQIAAMVEIIAAL